MRDRLNGLVATLGIVVAGCGSSAGPGGSAGGSDGGGLAAGSGGAAGGSAGLSGAAGGAGSGGTVSTGGGSGGAVGGGGVGGTVSTGGAAGSADGVAGSTGGVAGRGGAAGGGQGGASGTGGSGAAGAADGGTGNCKLPATVSFQKDVQPFLSTTCGGGSGCHVIDSASTTANGGYDHAYDWITAGAHPSSCPETPTPKRFEIVMAVIAAADPPSCSKSRVMPPQDETGAALRAPLTSCEIATL